MSSSRRPSDSAPIPDQFYPVSSAAVIGRQLRQQKTDGRTSGPLVPPQPPYKGRPRTPSHLPQRPYSPAPPSLTGTGDQRVNVIPGAQVYSHHYSSPSEREKQKNANKEEEPRLKCTWHCFCIALKALSGGIILLVAGTIMSVVGFVAEQNLVNGTFPNGTLIPANNATGDSVSTFRNLTYAGPVIMGLGGIVIVAACVLTFEVRDTLGVKVAPVKPTPPSGAMLATGGAAGSPPTVTTVPASRKNTIASISSSKAALAASSLPGPSTAGGSKSKALTLPLAVLSELNNPSGSGGGGFSKDRVQETIHETANSEISSANGASGSGDRHHSHPAASTSSGGVGGACGGGSGSGGGSQVSKSRHKYASADLCLTSPSSGTTFSHLLSPNIESLYFGLPSPQETECSDPEGCSLKVPARWRSSRCSCSGSPAHSLSLDLYFDDGPGSGHGVLPGPPPLNMKLYEQQRLQHELLIQQQILLTQQQQQLELQRRLLYEQRQHQHRRGPRRPKTIASVESDGLSSSSDSSEDLFATSVYRSHAPYQASVASRQATRVKPGRTCFSATVNVHNAHSAFEARAASEQPSDVTRPLLADSSSRPKTKTSSSTCSTITTANATSTPMACTTVTATSLAAGESMSSSADRRFPLLRQGALGNGSVHNKS